MLPVAVRLDFFFDWIFVGYNLERIRIVEDKVQLTHNFHIYVCSVLPSCISNHNRVDSLVLPLGPLNGEDAVTFGGLHVDPAVSLGDHLWGQQLHFGVCVLC